MSELQAKVLVWFGCGELGISSKAMACAVVGIPTASHKDRNHPYDPADFNRCLKFLNAVPEARQHFDKVAALSKTWAALISRWDEVEKCFIDEVGLDWCNGKKASKTYKLMKEIGC